MGTARKDKHQTLVDWQWGLDAPGTRFLRIIFNFIHEATFFSLDVALVNVVPSFPYSSFVEDCPISLLKELALFPFVILICRDLTDSALGT